mgnify:CR=1 FL=1
MVIIIIPMKNIIMVINYFNNNKEKILHSNIKEITKFKKFALKVLIV